jgi:hypothetical protein
VPSPAEPSPAQHSTAQHSTAQTAQHSRAYPSKPEHSRTERPSLISSNRRTSATSAAARWSVLGALQRPAPPALLDAVVASTALQTLTMSVLLATPQARNIERNASTRCRRARPSTGVQRGQDSGRRGDLVRLAPSDRERGLRRGAKAGQGREGLREQHHRRALECDVLRVGLRLECGVSLIQHIKWEECSAAVTIHRSWLVTYPQRDVSSPTFRASARHSACLLRSRWPAGSKARGGAICPGADLLACAARPVARTPSGRSLARPPARAPAVTAPPAAAVAAVLRHCVAATWGRSNQRQGICPGADLLILTARPGPALPAGARRWPDLPRGERPSRRRLLPPWRQRGAWQQLGSSKPREGIFPLTGLLLLLIWPRPAACSPSGSSLPVLARGERPPRRACCEQRRTAAAPCRSSSATALPCSHSAAPAPPRRSRRQGCARPSSREVGRQ